MNVKKLRYFAFALIAVAFCASSVDFREWARPRDLKTPSSKLCTPREILVTPACLYRESFSREIVDGDTSIVHSRGFGNRPNAPASFSNADSGKIDGVPPPQKIVSGGRNPGEQPAEEGDAQPAEDTAESTEDTADSESTAE